MAWLDYPGWALGAVFSLLSAGFILTALREGEGREALSVIFITLVVLPLEDGGELRIVRKQEQVDEWDNIFIFSRARYRPGTAEYEDYYSMPVTLS